MGRQEERSSGGMVLVVVLGLTLCILLTIGGAGGAWWYWRQQQAMRTQMMIMEYDASVSSQSQMAAELEAAAGSYVITIDIDAAGNYSIDQRVYSAEELATLLQEMAANKPESLAVKIRADGSAPAESAVAVFDICSEAGISNTALLAKEKE
jgi:biopolymer transport protein ExbD